MGRARNKRQRAKKKLPAKRDPSVERQLVRPRRNSSAVEILQLDTLTEERAKKLIELAAERMESSYDSKDFTAYAGVLLGLADLKIKSDKVQNERRKQELHLHQHQHGRAESDTGRTDVFAIAESLGLSVRIAEDDRPVIDGTVKQGGRKRQE